MGVTYTITTHAHGSLFVADREDPTRFRDVIELYAQVVTRALSDKAVTDIRAYLPTQYMYLGHNGGDPKHNPVPPNAGFLAASVHSDRVMPNRAIVTTDPVIYGPWIEGVAAGNMRIWKGRLRRGLPGRFPGYFAFRKIAQELDLVAADIAQAELPYFMIDLNA